MPSRAPLRLQQSVRSGLIVLALVAALLLPGCGALLLVGGAGTSAIAFATGELRASEPTPLEALDAACETVFHDNAYDEIETKRSEERVRWRAVTPGGEPVDVRLIAKGPDRTDVRIRIGVFGNESRSRLLLEQLLQAL